MAGSTCCRSRMKTRALLVTDDRIKLISFTGSAAVGWQIKKNSGKKKVILELGGNAGVIIHSDADLDYAAERCVAGGFALRRADVHFGTAHAGAAVVVWEIHRPVAGRCEGTAVAAILWTKPPMWAR